MAPCFWGALSQVYGTIRGQRCWVPKTASVLDKLPKSVQGKVRALLEDIWMAEARSDAESDDDFFRRAYGAKYDKAVDCQAKDRDRLLSRYEFSTEPRKHFRSANAVESTFAAVRFRTRKTKGCLSRNTALAVVFELLLSTRRKWHRLARSSRLAEVIRRATYKNGIKLIQHAA